MEIKLLKDVDEGQVGFILKQIEDIFFDSSLLKSFSSEEAKWAFYKRWCGDYQKFRPQEFFLMLQGQRVVGYLSGHANSQLALGHLEVPGFSIFTDLFFKFPAHLHINIHSDFRGVGMGERLIQHYVQFLQNASVRGVHLVTSPDAKNVSFYHRLGFNYTESRIFNNSSLYFMGRILD